MDGEGVTVGRARLVRGPEVRERGRNYFAIRLGHGCCFRCGGHAGNEVCVGVLNGRVSNEQRKKRRSLATAFTLVGFWWLVQLCLCILRKRYNGGCGSRKCGVECGGGERKMEKGGEECRNGQVLLMIMTRAKKG